MLNFIKFLYCKNSYTDYFCIAVKKESFKILFFKCTESEISKAINFISLSTGKNVYVSLNTFTYPQRTKEYCSNQIHNLFLDFDNIDAFRQFMQSEEYKYATIIQTSQNKYQVILKLKKPITKEKAEQITKYLARKFNSDIAATDCTRLIRMPYTYNHKYNPPFVVKVIKYASSSYTPPEIAWQAITYEKSLTSLSCDMETTPDSSLLEQARQVYQQILEKTPFKADNSTRDYSVADARFVSYMLRKGYTEKQIYSLLYQISPYLSQRKKGNVKQYLMRTIQAVGNFIASPKTNHF
ncbi:MAG: DNA-primase RepB domain-containing protein [Candidatus Micrarchaeia archaeon]